MQKYIFILVPTILINFVFYQVAFGGDFNSVSAVIKHYEDQLVKIDNLDADAREYFVTSEKRKSPAIVRADFNGDGKEDITILTQGELIFFICNKRCKVVKSVNYGGFAGFQYIIPIKKGQLVEEFGGFDNQPPTPSKFLKNPAVHLISYGKGSIAYYWDSSIKNFKDVTTGD
jgi:hypothetical protein